MTVHLTLVRTKPNAWTELPVITAAVLLVLKGQIANTILMNVHTRSANTMPPALTKSTDFIAFVRRDFQENSVRSTLMNVFPIRV